MRRLLVQLVVFGSVIGLLAACSAPVTSARLQFSLSESGDLGYEVDEDTITITSRNLRFRNTSGGHGVTITDYRISFFNNAGVAVAGGSQSGSVSVFVPAGILCDNVDPVYGCELGAPGWRFAPGVEVVSPQSYQLMPLPVVVAHINAGQPIGWYGEIEFTGFNATGGAFTTEPYVVAIAPPN